MTRSGRISRAIDGMVTATIMLLVCAATTAVAGPRSWDFFLVLAGGGWLSIPLAAWLGLYGRK